MSDLIAHDAVEIVRLLTLGAITPHDLLDALEERIALIDPLINALPTRCFDRARAHADRLMQLPLDARGPLAGLPVPIKDLTDVAGVRSTQGSMIFAQHIPQQSDLLVEHLEAQGGIVYAKSNTPEFGAGANTFNAVFGTTVNPYDRTLSVAGSSGGAAAALATGMAWVAHGSDFGGSLRNPASFCSVVGFRPTPGRVARTPPAKIDDLLNVEGPMARNVSDCALLFDAMCGADPRDPVSCASPGDGAWLAAARSQWRPLRVAYSADLGITPVDPEVAALTKKAALRLTELGVIVEEAHPNLSDAHTCFSTLRAYAFAATRADLLASHRNQLKPELVSNIEKGLALSTTELFLAEQQRAQMCRNAATFFSRYDLLLCPATIVPPYPVTQRFVTSCNGVEFSNYIEWLAIAYAISVIACPAMALPCGFTASGLPVGLQIVAAAGNDAHVFAGGRLLEDLLKVERILTNTTENPTGVIGLMSSKSTNSKSPG